MGQSRSLTVSVCLVLAALALGALSKSAWICEAAETVPRYARATGDPRPAADQIRHTPPGRGAESSLDEPGPGMWTASKNAMRDNTEIATAVIAGVFLSIGYLAAVIRQVLQSRSALALEQLRLRHEIARRWLEDFDSHAKRVSDALEGCIKAREHLAADNLPAIRDATLSILEPAHSLYRISRVIALSFRLGRRDDPGIAVVLAADNFANAVGAAVNRCRERIDELSGEMARTGETRGGTPADLGLQDEEIGRISSELGMLCAVINWAAELRISSPQVLAEREHAQEWARALWHQEKAGRS